MKVIGEKHYEDVISQGLTLMGDGFNDEELTHVLAFIRKLVDVYKRGGHLQASGAYENLARRLEERQHRP